jgi:alanine dehydrogenase
MTVTVGFPRMHKEEGERRDFLPELVEVAAAGATHVVVESGIGSGMGVDDAAYTAVSPRVRVGTIEEAYAQDLVVVLRAPIDRFEAMRPGATLLSMLHFRTRPARVQRLAELRIDAVSLDLIEDDVGRRLVENAQAVAWNGLEAAFDVLDRTWPALHDPTRPPVRVTILGAGQIGRDAVEAATKCGSLARFERLEAAGCLGVEVVTVGRGLCDHPGYLDARLPLTDVLVDATQRADPSRPIVTNEQVGLLPSHAVICDLAVDPYLLDNEPPVVRGIEGIPQGSLDAFTFEPDDPAWGEVPATISTAHRRRVVSCYSWPGVHPRECMELYGAQLAPLLETLLDRGGAAGLHPDGPFHERALWRASLRRWAAADAA